MNTALQADELKYFKVKNVPPTPQARHDVCDYLAFEKDFTSLSNPGADEYVTRMAQYVSQYAPKVGKREALNQAYGKAREYFDTPERWCALKTAEAFVEKTFPRQVLKTAIVSYLIPNPQRVDIDIILCGPELKSAIETVIPTRDALDDKLIARRLLQSAEKTTTTAVNPDPMAGEPLQDGKDLQNLKQIIRAATRPYVPGRKKRTR